MLCVFVHKADSDGNPTGSACFSVVGPRPQSGDWDVTNLRTQKTMCGFPTLEEAMEWAQEQIALELS